MPMYNIIEYSDNYSKTSGSLWQYYIDILAVNDDGNVVVFNGGNGLMTLIHLILNQI